VAAYISSVLVVVCMSYCSGVEQCNIHTYIYIYIYTHNLRVFVI